MVLLKASAQTESGEIPGPEIFEAMTKYNEELVSAGVLLAGEGLQESSKGKRVHFSGAGTKVTDGPFAETKELIAGYWMIQANSLDEAVAWARRAPLAPGDVLEVRKVLEAEDFGESFTPELREREEQMRERAAQQNR